MKITSKGAQTNFAAYDLEISSKTLASNLFISHADHDWDSKLQEKWYIDFLNRSAGRSLRWPITFVSNTLSVRIPFKESLHKRMLLTLLFWKILSFKHQVSTIRLQFSPNDISAILSALNADGCYWSDEICHQNFNVVANKHTSLQKYTKILVLSKWNEWSSCSSTCGPGDQRRTRICYQGCSDISSQHLTETQTCYQGGCPGMSCYSSRQGLYASIISSMLTTEFAPIRSRNEF